MRGRVWKIDSHIKFMDPGTGISPLEEFDTVLKPNETQVLHDQETMGRLVLDGGPDDGTVGNANQLPIELKYSLNIKLDSAYRTGGIARRKFTHIFRGGMRLKRGGSMRKKRSRMVVSPNLNHVVQSHGLHFPAWLMSGWNFTPHKEIYWLLDILSGRTHGTFMPIFKKHTFCRDFVPGR